LVNQRKEDSIWYAAEGSAQINGGPEGSWRLPSLRDFRSATRSVSDAP